ncbi:MAG: tRNA lysidine(34) synthetase TilS [Chitinispirillaceae bacterium]|nr:tRNA lysidine(34) synthetase TilS [Chitinispirillaceae bacterium]
MLRYARPLFSPGASVVVAVSGGGDSVALLFLLFELRERLRIAEMVVAHLNHALRGEDSEGDELLVMEYAGQLGLRCYTRRLSGYRMGKPGLEAAVRKERYRFFDEVREASGCGLIATGHTMDDQAETVLMRIIRGSGLNGLRGIAPLREDGIVRPLLPIRKQELIDWLTTKKIAFRSDVSNADTRFFRNRVRHILLPQLEACRGGAIEHCAAVAAAARQQWETERRRVTLWLKRHVSEASDGSFRIEKRGLAETGCASEGVRRILAQRGITPSRRHISGILGTARRTGRTFLLPEGWRYYCCRESLFFEKSFLRFDYPVAIPGFFDCTELRRRFIITIPAIRPNDLDQGKWTVYVDGAKVGERCRYRTVLPDDTFIPFGGGREVSVMKFLARQGISLPQRRRTGLLVDSDNKPIWIPGIRIDERFRITAETKKAIKIQSRSFL